MRLTGLLSILGSGRQRQFTSHIEMHALSLKYAGIKYNTWHKYVADNKAPHFQITINISSWNEFLKLMRNFAQNQGFTQF